MKLKNKLKNLAGKISGTPFIGIHKEAFIDLMTSPTNPDLILDTARHNKIRIALNTSVVCKKLTKAKFLPLEKQNLLDLLVESTVLCEQRTVDSDLMFEEIKRLNLKHQSTDKTDKTDLTWMTGANMDLGLLLESIPAMGLHTGAGCRLVMEAAKDAINIGRAPIYGFHNTLRCLDETGPSDIGDCIMVLDNIPCSIVRDNISLTVAVKLKAKIANGLSIDAKLKALELLGRSI